MRVYSDKKTKVRTTRFSRKSSVTFSAVSLRAKFEGGHLDLELKRKRRVVFDFAMLYLRNGARYSLKLITNRKSCIGFALQTS